MSGKSTGVPEFSPIECSVECPDCGKQIGMMLQPVHMTIDICCPQCGFSLTGRIRNLIRSKLSVSAA